MKRTLSHPAALYVAALLYTACGLVFSVRLYHNLHMFIWDMGVFDQVVWNTAHARWFASSLEVQNFLGDHFAPILALFGLFHHLVPSPYGLMLVQSLCFSLTAATVGWIILRQTRNPWIAWAAAVLLWCHPSSFGIIINDFSVLTPTLPIAVALYWCGRQGRFVLVAVLAVLMLSVREDAPIAMAAVGTILLWHPQRRMMAGMLIAIGLAAPVVGQWVLIPYFRDGQPADSNYRIMLPTDSQSAWDVLLRVALGPRQWMYLLGSFAALAFLPLLTGWRALVLVFAMGHLFFVPSTLSLAGHYATVPFSIAAVLLIILFCDIWPQRIARARIPGVYRTWVAAAVCVSVTLFLVRDVRTRLWVLGPDDRPGHFEEVAAFLPEDAAVAASSNVGSRIAHRENLYLWPAMEYVHILQSPEPIQQADYIFADARRERAWKRAHEIQRLHDAPGWQLVHSRGDFSLFHRTAAAIPAALADPSGENAKSNRKHSCPVNPRAPALSEPRDKNSR